MPQNRAPRAVSANPMVLFVHKLQNTISKYAVCHLPSGVHTSSPKFLGGYLLAKSRSYGQFWPRRVFYGVRKGIRVPLSSLRPPIYPLAGSGDAVRTQAPRTLLGAIYVLVIAPECCVHRLRESMGISADGSQKLYATEDIENFEKRKPEQLLWIDRDHRSVFHSRNTLPTRFYPHLSF